MKILNRHTEMSVWDILQIYRPQIIIIVIAIASIISVYIATSRLYKAACAYREGSRNYKVVSSYQDTLVTQREYLLKTYKRVTGNQIDGDIPFEKVCDQLVTACADACSQYKAKTMKMETRVSDLERRNRQLSSQTTTLKKQNSTLASEKKNMQNNNSQELQRLRKENSSLKEQIARNNHRAGEDLYKVYVAYINRSIDRRFIRSILDSSLDRYVKAGDYYNTDKEQNRVKNAINYVYYY